MLYRRTWRASKRCSIRGNVPISGWGLIWSRSWHWRPLPWLSSRRFFEGHSGCEIDADDAVCVGDAGGENSPQILPLWPWVSRVVMLCSRPRRGSRH